MTYHSQHGQDRYLHEHLFGDRRGGVFVEFGALDGLLDSNTLFFERELGWSGVLVEPNPVAFAALERNRPACRLENVAISDGNGTSDFLRIDGDFYGWSGLRERIEAPHRYRIERMVQRDQMEVMEVAVHDLAWLAERHGLHRVDFMSIDTEGSEEVIVRAFPWERLEVEVFCIENNFDNTAIPELMAARGYRKLAHLGTDDIYVRQDG